MPTKSPVPVTYSHPVVTHLRKRPEYNEGLRVTRGAGVDDFKYPSRSDGKGGGDDKNLDTSKDGDGDKQGDGGKKDNIPLGQCDKDTVLPEYDVE